MLGIYLNSSTLILLQIFNRRRAGELERLKIADFNNRLQLDENVNPNFYANLSTDTIAYAKQYVRLTMKGKLGKKVVVSKKKVMKKSSKMVQIRQNVVVVRFYFPYNYVNLQLNIVIFTMTV